MEDAEYMSSDDHEWFNDTSGSSDVDESDETCNDFEDDMEIEESDDIVDDIADDVELQEADDSVDDIADDVELEEPGDTADEEESSESEKESYNSNLVDSPGGTSKLREPIVPNEYLPNKEARFQSEDDAMKMYRLYAEKAGFDVRKNTIKRFPDDTIRQRYMVCSRNGKIPDRSTDTLDTDGSSRDRRNSNFKRTDCRAHIIFERESMKTNVFKIRKFEALHNHNMDTKEERRYSKNARRLTFKDKEYLMQILMVNIGATKAHKIQASLKGGYDHIGPERNDYKNFRKKIGNIIGDRDAQMIVDKMNLRMIEFNNYTLDYKCVNSRLNAMFWADEIDKMYYKEFRDVISFDATFRTNKYGMVFVPFTAIDNHKRSITVGAGLLSNETIESYKWLLNAFIKAHGKEPNLVLTDQDPAVIQAVESVFKNSKHRLCMWHIMKKLSGKVSDDLLRKTEFRKRFNKLVWNIYLEPEVFEKEWKVLIKKYKLEGKRWFKDMYECRTFWIPAYFRDMPMHGLMKTTSRSESTNSFFNKYVNSDNFLLFFMMNYDTAIEKQRNTHRKLEHETKKGKHHLKMPSALEKHASTVYTNEIFLDVQKEIYKGAWNCSLESVEMVNGLQVVMVKHVNKTKDVISICKVELKLPEVDVRCSCQLFTRMGILCRHVFAVLKNSHIEEIPEKYIMRRWRRDCISSHLILRMHGYVERQDETARLLAEAFENLEYCLDKLIGDKEKLLAVVESTRKMRKAVDKDDSIIPATDKNEEAAMKLLGVSIPEKIEIQVPVDIRNKGCRKKKRMVGALERASSSSTSKSRKCRGCNKYINHNWRTCPVRIARDEAEKDKEQ